MEVGAGMNEPRKDQGSDPRDGGQCHVYVCASSASGTYGQGQVLTSTLFAGMATPVAQIGKLRLEGWDACPTEIGGS